MFGVNAAASSLKMTVSGACILRHVGKNDDFTSESNKDTAPKR